MTHDKLIRLIREEIERKGSQTAAAAAMGVSASYVSDVLNNRRAPGESILRHFGLERVVIYRKVAA